MTEQSLIGPELGAERPDSGFIMVAMVIMLLPLTLIVAAFMSNMTGRAFRLREEVVQEKALLAAESGLDEAIYLAQTTGLTDGSIFARSFGKGMAFSVEPTYLGADLKDNDGDGDFDESDEDVYQLIIRGTYRGVTRRLAAYLGSASTLPLVSGAMSFQNAPTDIELKGSPLITGTDTNIDGSPGDPAKDVPGLVVAAPDTEADLLALLTPAEQSSVQGVGPTPSLGTAPPVDVDLIAEEAKNAANIVLTNPSYSSYDFGDASDSPPTGFITYREGDVKFSGNSRGAGMLVVTGNLTINGMFRFDGVIVCLGDIINSAGTAQVYGGILLGPTSNFVTLKGTADIYFSSQAIKIANNLTSRYVAFNGWQELSRK